MKKINPALDVSEGEVGDAAASWPYPDLTPLRSDLKKGARYRLHFRYSEEFEAPATEAWAKRTVTVQVIARGRGWIDERTVTFNGLYFNNASEPVREPIVPPGWGWTYEGPVAPRSSSWRRRREVA